MISLSTENTLNCEHVVPQSWFDKQEPMTGDLHHLFACGPTCNSRRGNHPYYDFLDYVPESRTLGITEGCEKHRNLAIYELQGNRNPFVDSPHLIEILK